MSKIITQLDQENADRDLTSLVTVLTHTPSASDIMRCQAHIALGDGSKDLDGSGGDFELTITIGSRTLEPDPAVIEFSTATQVVIQTAPFIVPANTEVIVKILSPNAADADVDVTATLYDVGDTLTANILEDTNELQTDWTNDGRLDALIDAIKAITDALPDSGALSSIAQASALTTVDTEVGEIKAVTDNLPDSGALTSIAQEATVDAVGVAVAAQNDFDPANDTVANVTTTATLTGKTGFSLSTAGIKAIWDQLTSALTTTGSIGKLLSRFGFNASDDVKSTLDGENVTVANAAAKYTGPVATDGDITIFKDDDYTGDGAITEDITGWSGYDLTGFTACKFRLLSTGRHEDGTDTEADLEVAATLTSITSSTFTWTASITTANKADLSEVPYGASPNYRYQVVATTSVALGSKTTTVAHGNCTILKTIDAVSA